MGIITRGSFCNAFYYMNCRTLNELSTKIPKHMIFYMQRNVTHFVALGSLT